MNDEGEDVEETEQNEEDKVVRENGYEFFYEEHVGYLLVGVSSGGDELLLYLWWIGLWLAELIDRFKLW